MATKKEYKVEQIQNVNNSTQRQFHFTLETSTMISFRNKQTPIQLQNLYFSLHTLKEFVSPQLLTHGPLDS
jgi:hypothetical protein